MQNRAAQTAAQINYRQRPVYRELQTDYRKTPDTERASAQDRVKEPALLVQREHAHVVHIEQAVPGTVIKEGDEEFLLIKRRLSDIDVRGPKVFDAFCNALERFGSVELDGDAALLSGNNPGRILFLDIETCGLSANPLFLIGAAFIEKNDFSVVQCFARTYDEERPLLSFFSRFTAQFELFVTYNGKSFDMPFIASRSAEHRIGFDTGRAHLDLLHEVRRRWKAELPDCRLQTVEKHVLGFSRVGDIPGIEIPRVYHEFVDTRNAGRILGVLEHNIRDIVSLIDIINLLTVTTEGTS